MSRGVLRCYDQDCSMEHNLLEAKELKTALKTIYCLGDPFKQMDLSSKCAAELEKHGEGYCLEKGWTAACPHSCRGTSLIFYLLLKPFLCQECEHNPKLRTSTGNYV